MKGENTRATILDSALSLARFEGLHALSIGRLAQRVGLSKSGLFAHFNSKEKLQMQVLERGVDAFVETVVKPAVKVTRGEPRLRALFERWLGWASDADQGGCLFLGASMELDDRPGALRDYLVQSQKQWTTTLARAVAIAQEEGHLADDVVPEECAFEIYSIMMGYHLYRRLLRDGRAEARALRAFDRLITSQKPN